MFGKGLASGKYFRVRLLSFSNIKDSMLNTLLRIAARHLPPPRKANIVDADRCGTAAPSDARHFFRRTDSALDDDMANMLATE